MANHDVKTFRFAGRLPKPTLLTFIEMQVSYGKTAPVPEYQVFFMMIVYLHVIEDIF